MDEESIFRGEGNIVGSHQTRGDEMSVDKLKELANEYECMANSHRAVGEKEEADSCDLIVKALRFYIVSLDRIPVAWRWVTDPGQVKWEFGAYAPSNATKKEPLFRGTEGAK